MPGDHIKFNRQLERLCQLMVDLSSPGGVTETFLAESHEVSLRTIQRDLDLLENEYGLWIQQSRDSRGCKRLSLKAGTGKRTGPLRSSLVLNGLDSKEIMLLAMGLGRLPLSRDSELSLTLDSLKTKLSVLYRGTADSAGEANSGYGTASSMGQRADKQREAQGRPPEEWILSSGRRAKTEDPNPLVLSGLIKALQAKRAVEARYMAASSSSSGTATASAGTTPAGSGLEKTHILDPVCLFDYDGGLYVFARKRGKDTMLPWAVERFASLRVLDEPSILPEDFDPEAYLRKAFNLVVTEALSGIRIYIDAQQAPYVRERVWGDRQTLEDQPDGGLILGFDTLGRSEVVRWILSRGSHARVLAPPELVEEVNREIRAMAKTCGEMPD